MLVELNNRLQDAKRRLTTLKTTPLYRRRNLIAEFSGLRQQIEIVERWLDKARLAQTTARGMEADLDRIESRLGFLELKLLEN